MQAAHAELPFELQALLHLTADDVPDVVETFTRSRPTTVEKDEDEDEDEDEAPSAECAWSNMREVVGARGVQKVLLGACRKGQLDTVRALVQYGVCAPEDLHLEDDYPFRLACANGNWHVAQFLAVEVGGVDTHARSGDAFRCACMQNRSDMAQWLHGLLPPGTSPEYLDIGFQAACHWGHFETAKRVWPLLAETRDAAVLVTEGHLGSACLGAELPMAQWMASLIPPAAMTAACPGLLENVCRRLRSCLQGLREEVGREPHGREDAAFVTGIVERIALIVDYFAMVKWLLGYGTGWPAGMDPTVRAAYDSWDRQ